VERGQPTTSNLILKQVTPLQNPRAKSNPLPQFTIHNLKPTISNVLGQYWHRVGNIDVKRKSTSTHKSLVETIRKGNVILMESINWIIKSTCRLKKNKFKHMKKYYKNN
jgi:hypothetical protein